MHGLTDPNPLVTKLEKRDAISEDERKLLQRAISRVKEYKPGEDVIRQGHRPTESALVLYGLTGRYRMLPSGAHQITSIHVPGDFVDLHGFLLKQMDHSVTALTPCKFAMVPHETLAEITEKYPHLTRLLWLDTVIDAAIHREWLVVLGRRQAIGKVAHFLCEMYLRLGSVGLADQTSFRLGLRQTDLGDVLGLSVVHVNRVVQSLRKQGLITWKGDVVTIEKWDQLVKVGEFEPSYLNLIFEPR